MTALPRILVESKYDPLGPAVHRAPAVGRPKLAPDIIAQGDISNLRGPVKIDSAAGSIRPEQKRDLNDNLIQPVATASITADEVQVKTRNGDFVQSYTDTFFHTAGAPLSTIPGNLPTWPSPATSTPSPARPRPPVCIAANGSVTPRAT